MGITSVIQAVQKFSDKTFSKPCEVITVKQKDEGWQAEMEMIVEDLEMRRFGRSPIMGLWNIELDNKYNVTNFERKGLKDSMALEYDLEED